MRRQLLFFVLLSSALLWTVNFIALKYDLYFITSWFDSISHTLGGIVVAGTYVYLSQLKGHLPAMLRVFLFVFVVGVAWEYFELYIGSTRKDDLGYFLDTISDICFDIFGAYIAYSFVRKKSYG